ncbi:hypothetical protein T35B1_18298 [Salinisphaera shabanensis T35B1]
MGSSSDIDYTGNEDDAPFENNTTLDESDTREAGTSPSQVRNRIYVLKRLYTQGPALEEAGIDLMPSDPFPDGGISKAVNRIATRAIGWIPPLPDDVAIPIMSAAARFIGVPANDIISLQDHFINVFNGDLAASRHPRKLAAGTASLMSFDFSVIPGEAKPWREPIQSTCLRQYDRTETRSTLTPVMQLRRLIMQVLGAAAVVVQSYVGMRISEICSLVTESVDQETGLPSCINVRRSNSGLNQIFGSAPFVL